MPEIIKPRFISKAKREKLKKQKQIEEQANSKRAQEKLVSILASKQTASPQSVSSEPSEPDTTVTRPKKPKKSKFQFEWDETEDTSQGYEPLVEAEPETDDLVASKQINWDDKHWKEKRLDDMTSRDWRILQEDYEITYKGHVPEHPLRSWQESEIPEHIVDVLQHKFHYAEPTAIQRAAIPVALSGRDVLGIAETGSGKTLSFLVPLFAYLDKLPEITIQTKNDGPYALILVPTRELAQQIHNEVQKFSRYLKVRSSALYGGHQLESNVLDLQDGIHILIATPGRLLDCLDRKILVLNQCFYLVMDEADRMIDLGFEEQVNNVLSALPVCDKFEPLAVRLGVERRTTMMFSATLPSAIEKLTQKYLQNARTITIGTPSKAAESVEQRVELVANDEMKQTKLVRLLNSRKFKPPIIVFVNYKKTCEVLHDLVQKSCGLRSVVIHGSKSQDQREFAINGLKNGKFDVLIATDLAGRGIDIANVSLVVNYQMSKNIEEYVHRIGRTGRAGNLGVAITFIQSEVDKNVIYDLKKMIERSKISKLPNELKNNQYALARPNSFKDIRD